MSIADLRTTYDKAVLLENDLADHPLSQFSNWFDQALKSSEPEPNAMTLATSDAQGQPCARTVLLKGVDARGLVFFTNYQSRKGQELGINPQACLLFFWQTLQRQVRFEGRVEPVSAAESDAYFHSRPLGSRIAAWASPQSRPTSREALQTRWQQLSVQLGQTPERPPHWGGYRLIPERVEFWQGRPSRLHDRLLFERSSAAADDTWRIIRLAP